jgi:hypothetical protein
LSSVLLARIRRWCHIALPVKYEFRSAFKIEGNGIDDTSRTNGFIPFGRPKLKHSKFRLQHLTILRHDWQLERTANRGGDFLRRWSLRWVRMIILSKLAQQFSGSGL